MYHQTHSNKFYSEYVAAYNQSFLNWKNKIAKFVYSIFFINFYLFETEKRSEDIYKYEWRYIWLSQTECELNSDIFVSSIHKIFVRKHLFYNNSDLNLTQKSHQTLLNTKMKYFFSDIQQFQIVFKSNSLYLSFF